MKAGLHSILLQPLLTEKITAMRESNNTVGFLVHPDANRVQIKQAVEALLKVKVERVNVMNVRGKVKRLGRFSGKRSDWKKAFVKLKQGASISAAELKAFIADSINKLEMPREIIFKDQLPKTLIGKLSKKELVAEEARKSST